MLAAQEEPLRPNRTGVEIEVQVVAERTDRAEGGLKVWVVNLGGESAATAVSTQTVRLSLTPRLIDSQGPVERNAVHRRRGATRRAVDRVERGS